MKTRLAFDYEVGYFLTDWETQGEEVDLPDDLVQQFHDAEDEWYRVQHILCDIYKDLENKKILETSKSGRPSIGFN